MNFLDYIYKKEKKGKVIFPILFVLGIIVVVAAKNLLKGDVESGAYGFLAIVGYSFILIFCIFKYAGYIRLAKYIRKNNLEEDVKLMDKKNPTFPKSKICCGKECFYVFQFGRFIRYSDVKWAYGYIHIAMIVPVETIKMYFGKEKCLIFSMRGNEMTPFLENYLIPNSPGILIGNDGDQEKQYLEKNHNIVNHILNKFSED